MTDPFSGTTTWGAALAGEEVRFLTHEEAVAIHGRVTAAFGGTFSAPDLPSGSGDVGVRDPGLLESALYRPRSGHYGDVAEMATALLESLLLTRPFTEGNRRASFFVTDTFLRMNGWRLEVEAAKAHAFLRGLYGAFACRFEHLLPVVRSAMVRNE